MFDQMKNDIEQLRYALITVGDMVSLQADRIAQLEDELIKMNNLQMKTVTILGDVVAVLNRMNVCQ